jgi:hypothetical protein
MVPLPYRLSNRAPVRGLQLTLNFGFPVGLPLIPSGATNAVAAPERVNVSGVYALKARLQLEVLRCGISISKPSTS